MAKELRPDRSGAHRQAYAKNKREGGIMKKLQAAFYITGILFFALAIGILLQFIL